MREEPARGRGRRLLEHLLVAPLHRAVALSERDHVSVCVREQLHLDVARPLEVALAVERAVAEGSRRLALGCRERLVELGRQTGRRAFRGRRHLPPPSPAAGSRSPRAHRRGAPERRPRARCASPRACRRRAAALPAEGRPTSGRPRRRPRRSPRSRRGSRTPDGSRPLPPRAPPGCAPPSGDSR